MGCHKLPGRVLLERPLAITVTSSAAHAMIPIRLVIASLRIGKNRVGVRIAKERSRTVIKSMLGQKDCNPSPNRTTMATLATP